MTNIKTVKPQAFGRVLHYVLDPKYAAALTSLTGKKTINDKDIANLETLGIAVNLKPETQLAFAGVQYEPSEIQVLSSFDSILQTVT